MSKDADRCPQCGAPVVDHSPAEPGQVDIHQTGSSVCLCRQLLRYQSQQEQLFAGLDDAIKKQQEAEQRVAILKVDFTKRIKQIKEHRDRAGQATRLLREVIRVLVDDLVATPELERLNWLDRAKQLIQDMEKADAEGR